MSTEKENLLRPEEVARKLNIALSTVYGFAHRGILPSVKLGRSLRFRPGAIEKLLDQQEKFALGKAA